jgi:anti-anti-sigma factor
MTSDDRAQTLPGELATPGLTTHVRSAGLGVVRVEVTGEIDMTNAADLAAALRQAVDTRPDRLEVDLSGVTFLGCAGLDALRTAQRSTPALVVTAAPRAARRLLAIGGLAVS